MYRCCSTAPKAWQNKSRLKYLGRELQASSIEVQPLGLIAHGQWLTTYGSLNIFPGFNSQLFVSN